MSQTVDPYKLTNAEKWQSVVPAKEYSDMVFFLCVCGGGGGMLATFQPIFDITSCLFSKTSKTVFHVKLVQWVRVTSCELEKGNR